MRVTYDRASNAVYIYLKERSQECKVAKTYLCDPIEVNGQINLDFDGNNVLIGIEVLDADKMLPEELLDI